MINPSSAGRRFSVRKIYLVSCTFLLAISSFAIENLQDNLGLPVFPGAESKPLVARAVEAYYKPGIARTQSLTASMFETPAAFQKVSDFYRPRMDPGEYGWRIKTRALVQQTETLKFMRAQLLAQQGKNTNRLPDVFKPLFGDPQLSQSDFSAKLDQLLKRNKRSEIQVAEGTITVRGSAVKSQVRITIERPYIDVEKMKLVDKTRIVMVKVS
jgi:hypothetical protein